MQISELVGQTVSSVDQGDGERVTLDFTDGTAVCMVHHQCCCESVSLHHIEGDLNNLIGHEIVSADEHNQEHPFPEGHYIDSYTWTNYRFVTAAGEVTFVWLGESNGYYGETPYLELTHPKI
jgi:hypothetical protein